MVDIMLEDAGREDFADTVDSLMEGALEEVRAALHELVDLLERDIEEVRAELYGMPIASNAFPPTW